MSEDAHVMFPNDIPASAKPDAPPAGLRQVGEHTWIQDRQPTPAAKPANASPPTASQADDTAASLLFKDDVVVPGAKDVRSIFETHEHNAMVAGDHDRADAIRDAGDMLLDDFRQAGGDARELADVLREVHAGLADTIVEKTPEQVQQEHTAALAAVHNAGFSTADLNSARRLIDHLEKVSPGLKLTLERTGKGNDLGLIRRAVAEAKRRGL